MCRMMKGIVTALMMSASGVHAAETAKCLTRPEASALVVAVMPNMIDGIVKVCAPVLPEAANLRDGLAPLMARYRPAADAAWPQALPAVQKLAGEDLKGIAIDALKPMFAPVLTNLIAKDIKPTDCPQIDRIVGGVASMSPHNLADVVVAILELDRGKGRKNDLSICPAALTAP